MGRAKPLTGKNRVTKQRTSKLNRYSCGGKLKTTKK